MSDEFDALQFELDNSTSDFKIEDEARADAIQKVMLWVVDNSSKATPAYEDKVAAFQKQVESLVNNATFTQTVGEFTLKPQAADTNTLLLLRRGSMWFRGNPDIDKIIIGAFLQM